VHRLLSCSGALQGVLPKLPPAASFSQSSEVDGEILHAIMAAGGRDQLVSWALWWGFMPSSKCESFIILYFKSHSENYSRRRSTMKKKKKNARPATAMNMMQLPTLALAAQSLGVTTKREIQS
jgi:hypothetical protein